MTRTIIALLVIMCLGMTSIGGGCAGIKVAPLSDEDFAVTDGTDTIRLDTPFIGLKTAKIRRASPHVGWISKGKYHYKYNQHIYDDFDVFTSNAHYELKGRTFDDRYITQITIRGGDFRTARGITIGSTVGDVTRLYGEGKVRQDASGTMVKYRLRDMALVFWTKQDKVTGIMLNVVVNEPGQFWVGNEKNAILRGQ